MSIFAERPEQAAAGLQSAQARVQRLEEKYSRFQAGTITSRINQAAGTGDWVPLDHETYQLFCLAQEGYRLSDGLFDITSGVLRQAWDFKRGCLPAQSALETILPLIGMSQLRLRPLDAQLTDPVASLGPRKSPEIPSGWAVSLPHTGMEIDFGGLVKEYAADAAAKVLQEHGIGHGFVDLGGDLSIIGPHPEIGAWPIGVRAPRSPTRPISRLHVCAGAVATSGDYERFFERNGQRYCHILNPKTGWPVLGWASVTVVTSPCVVAGMAATVAMLKGVREGVAWLQELGVPFFAVTAPARAVGLGGDDKAYHIVTEQSSIEHIDKVLDLVPH
jgi:thiamine biosynthesis lipoprotein